MDSLISFIIPMYNMELYIDNCVKSIQSQFLKEEEYEVIIVDDGSTDSSLDICLEIARSNHNIKVFHQDNQGVGEIAYPAKTVVQLAFVQDLQE